jgi:hypothetical protein
MLPDRTSTGAWRQITDFGDRPIFIARRVSWSSDGRSILAAVGEGDADVLCDSSALRCIRGVASQSAAGADGAVARIMNCTRSTHD